jgi:hypothetical protein
MTRLIYDNNEKNIHLEILFCQKILEHSFTWITRFFLKRKNWHLGKHLIYTQQRKLYRMCASNFLHIHFHFFPQTVQCQRNSLIYDNQNDVENAIKYYVDAVHIQYWTRCFGRFLFGQCFKLSYFFYINILKERWFIMRKW